MTTRRSSVFQPVAWAVAGAAVTVGLVLGAGALNPARASVPAVASNAPLRSPVAGPNFAQIVKDHGAAVVNIQVVNTSSATDAQAMPGMPGMDPNDPFFQFFRQFQPPGWTPPPHAKVVRGLGSGFIVSSDGLIFTNAHVVKAAKSVNVRLTDGREFKAKVVGMDEKTDIALLRIEAKNLPVVPLGSSKKVSVGEWVMAMGSPFGFDNTVTVGVVSAKRRSLPDDSTVPFIQTDVAINPGNSGGPLFNAQGEVVGINSQIYTRSGGYQGVSFAIPIEVAQQVKAQLLEHGKVQHARLGVMIQGVNFNLAKSLGLDRPTGALVANVEPGSAAEQAGLKSGDLILSINGEALTQPGELTAYVGQAKPGDAVKLKVWRHKQALNLEAKLGNADNTQTAQASPAGEGQGTNLGLGLRPLTPLERQSLGGQNGLLVEQVLDPALQAGVMPGDVIVDIEGQAVASLAQARSLVAKAKEAVSLKVIREGMPLYLAIPLA